MTRVIRSAQICSLGRARQGQLISFCAVLAEAARLEASGSTQVGLPQGSEVDAAGQLEA